MTGPRLVAVEVERDRFGAEPVPLSPIDQAFDPYRYVIR
jgi:hypothetical protein